MALDWIARPNNAFASQAKSFSAVLNADYAAYNISAGEAAQLADEYSQFADAFAATNEPATRTSVAVAARNIARKKLAAHMRDIAARVRADSTIGSEARIALGLTVPGLADVQPESQPATRPAVFIRELVGNRLTVRLSDAQSFGRLAKPRGAHGAEIFFTTGDEADTDPRAWQRGGLTLSSKATINLPYFPPGTKVWIAARWFDSRGKSGPVSSEACTYVGGMLMSRTLAA